MLKILKYLLYLPKTIYLNFKVFSPEKALKLPVVISGNVSIKGIYKGCIEISAPVNRFMIKFGFGGSPDVRHRKGLLFLNKSGNAKLIFNGKATFGKGLTIYNDSGTITFGDNFNCNKNCFFSCNSTLTFGEDVLLGWDINIRDSDGHKVIPQNEKSSDIIIGNHVWICSCADILKSTQIGSNCIIAYRSCCTGTKCGDGVLVGGYPAKVIKDGVSWEH